VTTDPQRPVLPTDLVGMGRWLAEANPGHYRQLALYLQVLRELLPASVDQAIFQLVTQVHPGRYASLPADQRARLHQRLVALVQGCASLLTVEQLSGLAARQHRQRRQRQQRRQQRLVERLIAARLAGDDESDRGSSPDDPDRRDLQSSGSIAAGGFAPAPAGPAVVLPPGSVSLGMDPPLRANLIGWSAETSDSSEADFDDPLDDPADPEGRPSGTEDGDTESFGWGSDGLDPSIDLEGSDADLALLEAEASLGAEGRDGEDHSGGGPWASAGNGAGLLPRDPVQLEAWLRGYDQALARRLRNLSQAINGELMRSGLLSILLPTSILDAVLDGRIDSLGAPPNLLRLQLPMPLPGSEHPFQATVVLLRCIDLELDQPRLRHLRRELQRRRQEGRRMAHQFRRLQRRGQAREAEALWLQDIRTRQQGAQNPPSTP